jgi:hypothetical protein
VRGPVVRAGRVANRPATGDSIFLILLASGLMACRPDHRERRESLLYACGGNAVKEVAHQRRGEDLLRHGIRDWSFDGSGRQRHRDTDPGEHAARVFTNRASSIDPGGSVGAAPEHDGCSPFHLEPRRKSAYSGSGARGLNDCMRSDRTSTPSTPDVTAAMIGLRSRRADLAPLSKGYR